MGGIGGSGRLPKGFTKKLSVILDDRDWFYNGTRFVSPLSSDAGDVMLFEGAGVAESVAKHLQLRSVASGIHAKHGSSSTLKGSRWPPIVGMAPPTKGERIEAKRKETRAFKEQQEGPRDLNGRHYPPLLLSETRTKASQQAQKIT